MRVQGLPNKHFMGFISCVHPIHLKHLINLKPKIDKYPTPMHWLCLSIRQPPKVERKRRLKER